MRAPSSTYLCKRHQTPHPAANIIRCNDIDLMDSIFSDTPAVATGETVAQIIAALCSKFTSIHGMKGTTEDDILGAFQDRVHWHGAPEEVSSDDAAVYKGHRFTNYCRDLYISLWQSEAYHQNQNYAENVWETFKRGTNRMLDFTGAPASWWLLGLLSLHKSGTILLMLTLVMVLVLPTWLLLVAVTISVLISATAFTSPSRSRVQQHILPFREQRSSLSLGWC